MQSVTRAQVEDFLYQEAALLDEWRLLEWASLFTEDGVYQIPNPDNPPSAPPGQVVYFIADDKHRLTERAKRLGKKTAHSEYPHSRTLHNLSNVRLLDTRADTAVAACNFAVYRTRHETTDQFLGRSQYRLCRREGVIRIREKIVWLALDALRPQGGIPFIL